MNPTYKEDGIDLYLGDCLEIMKQIPDKSIDLVVTSPPYFNQREYSQWENRENYHSFILMRMKEIKRVVKGIVCWNCAGDRAYDLKSWHSVLLEKAEMFYTDTIEWIKKGRSSLRGKHIFRGMYYPFFTHEPIYIYKTDKNYMPYFEKDDIHQLSHPDWSCNVWRISNDSKIEQDIIGHPATFPLELPKMLIKAYSKKNSTVLDPFMGSGTTGVACKELGRKFIGIEIESKYFEIAKRRISNTQENLL